MTARKVYSSFSERQRPHGWRSLKETVRRVYGCVMNGRSIP